MSSFLIVNTQVYHIVTTPLSIGRNLDNHLVIQEPTVSRKHAEIRLQDDQYLLIDLDSTSGTFLNGKQVQSQSVLHSGDSILIADTPIVFVDNAPHLTEKATTPTSPLRPDSPIDGETTPDNKSNDK